MRISAVILAGGKGERLFPLTNTRPKPLCPVGGVYPLERAIELAREAGAGEIIVTAGYMASSIEAYTRGMENVTTLREEKPLSTAGAVRNARPSGDIIIVLCGDTLCGFSLLPAVKAQMNGDCDATIVTTRSKAPTEYGIVTVTDGRVTGFLEKPSWNGVTGDEVNTGIYILRRRVLELIPPETPYDFGGELFPKMVADGKPIAVFRADGYWCDMGSPKTYFLANMLATGGENAADGSAVIHEKARVRHSVIMSDVYIGRNSEIEGSIICENVKIGRGCHIGAGCIVGGSTVIEDGCTLEKGVTVTNGVIIGKDTHVMKNIYSNEFKTRLFDSDLGVGGVYGSSFDIADAVYLGQALCSQSDGRAKIGVMSGSGSFSRILAGVTVGGIRFGGGDALSLGDGFYAECAWAARNFGLDFSVFVDVDDTFGICISVFDKNGMPIPRETQRRLERVFFRRSQPKIPKPDDEDIKTKNADGEYRKALAKAAGDLGGVRISVSGDGLPAELAGSVINEAGGETVSDGDVFSLSPDGRRVTAVSKNGTRVSYWHLWCYVTGEAVKNGDKNVAMPLFSPITAAEYLGSLGGRISYFSDSETDDRSMAGEQWLNCDGCHLLIRAVRLMKEQSLDLDAVMGMLPRFYIRELSVPVDEDEKAERARYLHDTCDDSKRCSTFVFGSGRVSVMPSNGAFFKLFAEAVSSEAAEEIALEVKKKISQ